MKQPMNFLYEVAGTGVATITLNRPREGYRAVMGKHFPAMILVEVKSLLDSQVKIEIEAVAVLADL